MAPLIRRAVAAQGRRAVAAQGRRAVAALVVAALVPVVVAALLHGRWLLDPAGSHPMSAFGASHVWGLDHIAQMLVGHAPLRVHTDALGFPTGGPAPTLGWGPALLALPFRPLGGPLVAYAGALLATMALAGAAAWAWLRSAVGAAPWAATVGAVVFGTSPAMLNNLALGNIDKLSVWVYPAWLWLGVVVVRGDGRVPVQALALVGATLVALLAPMSEPYLGLFLPLVGVPAVALEVVGQGAARRWGAVARALLLLGATAAAMLPARSYFSVYTEGVRGARVFRPASVTTFGGGDGFTQPWAALPDLVWPVAAVPDDPERAFHVFYLGLIGLSCAVGLAALPGVKRRAVGGIVLGLGLLLVLGPYTVLPERWGLPGPQTWRLPVTLLERVGYPLAIGGQYYRALPLVSLGVAALAAAGLSARRGPVALGLGLLLPALTLGEGLGATRPAWPRPVEAVPCRAVLASIAAQDGPGAVLNTRLQATQAQNGKAMMLATLHGRAIHTLPVQTRSPSIDAAYPGLRPLERVTDSVEATRWLHAQGFRFLLDSPFGLGAPPALRTEQLQAALGPPTWQEGDCRVWDLGPLPAPPAAGPAPGPGRG